MYRFFKTYEDEPTRGEQLQQMAERYGVTQMQLAEYLRNQDLDEFKLTEEMGGPSSTKNFERFAAFGNNPELLFNQTIAKTLPKGYQAAMGNFGFNQFLQGNI
jgi:hypothetical protein